METKLEDKEEIYVDASVLYDSQIIHCKIEIPFHEIVNGSSNITHEKMLENHFKDYARKHIVNKCHKEGYISGNPFKIISYSAGKTIYTNVVYDVVYEFKVRYPCEGMRFQCIIQSITKIGIKAVVDKDEYTNPIVVFASHLHNPNIFESDESTNGGYKEGQMIQVTVLGYRFEINDPSIYVIAKIIN